MEPEKSYSIRNGLGFLGFFIPHIYSPTNREPG